MKNLLLYIMVLFYAIAGINHFIHPGFYSKIIPPRLPRPMALVYVSGICEVLFAFMLLPAATRHIGAWLLILLLVAIFPANLQMAINYWQRSNPYWWVALIRLPLQLVLIWWAYIYTKS